MEQYRSKINQYDYNNKDFNVGDRSAKPHRHAIETSTGDFFTLDERKDVYIKVAERLSVLFKRQIYLRWDSGNLKVFFEKKDGEGEYSVVEEASGLVNVVSILAALYDEEIEFLLIDEPEVSLHPQLQSYLLREMRNVAKRYGKTIIISTHSSEMISLNNANDICNFVFFSEGNLPKQVETTAPELKNIKLGDFIIRMGQVYKSGFFAKKVLLIEGASDLILCRYLADRLEYNIDVAGAQIIPVDGKGQFPVVTKLFRLVNKNVSILTDLDGFIDNNDIVDLFSKLPEANEIASKHGANSISDMVRNIKTKISEMVDNYFIDMRPMYENHPYWINRRDEDDEKKIAKRAMIGALFCAQDNEIDNWIDGETWRLTKNKIEAILSILGELGCFVLRKGAIESYYHYASSCTYVEKPSAAAEETAHLNILANTEVENQYLDVINALKYISMSDVIDESYAVKKELLSELALVLELVKNGSTEDGLYAAIKQAKNNSTSLFKYNIVTDEDHKGVKVDFKSDIIQVNGFPFIIYSGDNVNEAVERNVRNK